MTLRNIPFTDRLRKPQVYLPIMLLISILIIWELIVRIFNIPSYLLPTPSKIAASFEGQWSNMLVHTKRTLYEAITGYLIGNFVGFLLALIMVQSLTLEQAIYPIVVAIRVIPIIAVTPLLILWLGFNIRPIIATSALLCFFPALVNGVTGLKSADPNALELMRLLNANRFQILGYVRFQYSLPHLFAALKLAVPLAYIGAVVGEWVSSDTGLGFVILYANNYVNTLLLFRSLIMLAVVGLASFWIVMIIESRILRWQASEKE